jgi:hypothetical protein
MEFVRKFINWTALVLFIGSTITAHSMAAELPNPNSKTLLALEKTQASDQKLEADQIHRSFVGNIDIPSGQVVALDPISLTGADDVFTQKFPAGSFAVFVYVMRVDETDKRIALAELRISEDPVSYWKLAQMANRVPPKYMEDSDYGYSAESATGAFMSPESLKAVTNPKLYPDGGSLFSEFLQPVLASAEQPAAFLFKLPNDQKISVAVFETGDSDGVYPSYVGFDKAGSPVKLVTTFFMIEKHSH